MVYRCYIYNFEQMWLSIWLLQLFECTKKCIYMYFLSKWYCKVINIQKLVNILSAGPRPTRTIQLISIRNTLIILKLKLPLLILHLLNLLHTHVIDWGKRWLFVFFYICGFVDHQLSFLIYYIENLFIEIWLRI
jgi:hypothetical protein